MVLSASYLPRRPSVISDMIDGEVIIVDTASGAYYSLDHCGSVVWQALEAGVTVEQAIAQVQQRFEGEPAAIAQAVEEFVAHLAAERLMVEHPVNGASATAALPPAPATGRVPFTTRVPFAARMPFAAPTLQRYDDMEDLIMLDPIHEIDDSGWPVRTPGAGAP